MSGSDVEDRFDTDVRPYVIDPGDYDIPPIFQITERRPFPSADQVIRAVAAGCEIDLGVDTESGLTFDLRTIGDAIPHLRRLRISDSRSVSGWGELSRAAALTSLVVLDDYEPPEVLRVAELPQLEDAGVLGDNCLTVCDNPHVTTLALRLPRSRSTPIIRSPLTGMSLTSKVAHLILDRMAQPALLTDLLIVGARDFDCRSLQAFPNLEQLEFQFCVGVRHGDVLTRLSSLKRLEFYRSREIDDRDAVVSFMQGLSEAGPGSGMVSGITHSL